MAGVKKPLSYLDLDRANPTATLFEKLFRDSVDYKKEIDDVFEAIVLTDPTLATKNAEDALKNQLFTIPEENPNSRTTYIFIARIIGRDSPHLFLPDPLEFNVTNDEECKKRYHNLLQLHTKVTANGLSVSEMPAKGDTVQIRLTKGDYNYKTAFCNDFLGVITKASANPEVLQKLKDNETGSKGAFAGPIVATAEDLKTYGSIDFLVPEFRAKIDELITKLKARKMTPRAHETWRSQPRQKVVYDKGRSLTEKSGAHGEGCAVDFIDGRPHPDRKGLYVGWGSYEGHKNYLPNTPGDLEATKMAKEFFNILGEETKKLGLTWGGTDFPGLVDLPHVEAPRAIRNQSPNYATYAEAEKNLLKK
jgi:hypothetical protein